MSTVSTVLDTLIEQQRILWKNRDLTELLFSLTTGCRENIGSRMVANTVQLRQWDDT